MKRHVCWSAAILIMVLLQLSACQQKPDAPAQIAPSKVDDAGAALHRVRLTARRAAELGIQTTSMREVYVSGKLRKVVPAAAVARDQHGISWVFKNPDSLVFVRERVSVDTIDGDWAVLAEGPSSGTTIVTAGVAGLLSDVVSESGERSVERKTIESDKAEKSVGTATLKEDGTIRLVYRTEGAAGLSANVIVEYKPGDEEYQKILDHVGGLQVGETKRVPRWPDQ